MNGNNVRESNYVIEKQEAPLYLEILCYISYIILICFGYLRDFLRAIGLEKNKSATERNRQVCPLFD